MCRGTRARLGLFFFLQRQGKHMEGGRAFKGKGRMEKMRAVGSGEGLCRGQSRKGVQTRDVDMGGCKIRRAEPCI